MRWIVGMQVAFCLRHVVIGFWDFILNTVFPMFLRLRDCVAYSIVSARSLPVIKCNCCHIALVVVFFLLELHGFCYLPTCVVVWRIPKLQQLSVVACIQVWDFAIPRKSWCYLSIYPSARKGQLESRSWIHSSRMQRIQNERCQGNEWSASEFNRSQAKPQLCYRAHRVPYQSLHPISLESLTEKGAWRFTQL